jgi:hypothetical protein
VERGAWAVQIHLLRQQAKNHAVGFFISNFLVGLEIGTVNIYEGSFLISVG